MNLGTRIAEVRKKKKLTQQQLADKIYITDKTISSWEQNRTEPSLEQIISLCEVLECSIHYLLHGNSSKNDIETELKFKLTKEEYLALEEQLRKQAKFLNESNHIDTYYEPSYKTFKDKDGGDERLRIGKRGNKTILTYKKKNKINCDEYEVEVDDFESLEKIFIALDLKPIAIVEKTRKAYSYLNKYEIVLDNVKDLGYFIEIEIKKYDNDITEEYKDLLKIARNLNINLNNIVKKSYLEHFIK